MPDNLTVAATAPSAFNVGGEEHNPTTVAMIAGDLTDPAAIAGHVERHLGHHVALVEQARAAGAEVVLLTEDCARLCGLVRRHGDEPWCRQVVDAALATWTATIGTACREHGVTVIGGTVVHRDGRYFNTAIAQDPDGQVIGTYDKTHLPEGEAEYLTPGEALPVFDAPFGRFGMLICWDILFPEAFAELALQGASIVFQPTFGHQGDESDITARARAIDWSIPLAVSMWNGPGLIVDAHGRIVARTESPDRPVALASLDLTAPRQVGFMEDARTEKHLHRRTALYRTMRDGLKD